MSWYTTDIRLDRSDERIVIEYSQDCEAIIDSNKRAQTEPQKSDAFRHIATIPAVLVMRWLNEERDRGNPMRMAGKEYLKLLYRKVQDPEYRWLRTDCPNSMLGWRR